MIPGNVPDPRHLPAGCRFNPRCPCAIARCSSEAPELVAVRPAHGARCLRAAEIEAGTLDPVSGEGRRV